MRYTIYAIRCKQTRKVFYVGQTMRKLSRRLSEHRCVTHNGAAQKLIQKYGKNNIEIVPIDYAYTLDDALTKEAFWIRFLDYRYSLQNRVHGTNGGFFDENMIRDKHKDALMLIRKSRDCESPYLYTWYHTLFHLNEFWGKRYGSVGPMKEENKKAISEALKRKYKSTPHHMLGKHLSEATKAKLSAMFLGRKLTEEHCRKISEKLTGIKRRPYTEEEKIEKQKKSPRNKPVVCINTGIVYFSASEAARQTGARQCHITSCCTKHRRSAGKLEDGTPLLWKYADNSVCI